MRPNSSVWKTKEYLENRPDRTDLRGFVIPKRKTPKILVWRSSDTSVKPEVRT